MSQPARILVLCTLSLFLFSLLWVWSGISESLQSSVRDTLIRLSSTGNSQLVVSQELPDFGQYLRLRTISEKELALERRRLIIIGDIHGMKTYVDKLLTTVSYDPSDLFVHLGDTISKGPDSLSLLQQLTDGNITGVRGNHEQKVIEWRGWIEWVESQEGGKEWLADLERSQSRGIDAWKSHRHQGHKWPIPKGWKFMRQHYRIARSLNAAQYSYLKSLPLVIHIPSLHTHLVHAGILPFDPKFPPFASEQPLARVPKISAPPPTKKMRIAQERALLTEIDPNKDPWVLLNMRSVLGNNRVSRKSNQGTPWSDLWDMTMKRCRGYHQDGVTLQDDATATGLSRPHCLPINVVYGHAASRGLDIKRWSFGLDTGCVYGRNLTAMVVTSATTNSSIDDEDTHVRDVPFGEHGTARLTSIPCSS